MHTPPQDGKSSSGGAAKSPLPHPGRTKAEIETAAEKPAKVRPNADGIPATMRALRQWVLWRWEKDDNGRWTKVPYSTNGRKASSTKPSSWATLEECRAVWRLDPDKYDGVGFMFAKDGGITGTDLDNAIDVQTGDLKPWAKAKVRRLDTYCEVSPTGTGVKLWALASKPGAEWCKEPFADGEIEMYDRARFFTVTGAVWPGCPATVESRQEAVTEIYHEVLAAKAAKKAAKKKPAGTNGFGMARTNGAALTDDQIIDKAERANGDKFRRLMAGSTADYEGDPSRADAGLCSILAFWTRDKAQIDRIFRRSKLVRDKWDSKRGETTYGGWTIDNALAFVTEHYGTSDGHASRNGHASRPPDGTLPPAEGEGQAAECPAPQPHLTDRGNGIRMVRMHGENLRHCIPWRKWLIWDGGRWRIDDTAAATRCAKDVPAELYRWAQQEIAAVAAEGEDDA